MTIELSAALDELAHRQQRLLTRAQVLAGGHTDMFIYRRVRGGSWQRVLTGVYCVTGGELTDEQRRVAAVLYAGPSAQITGPSALAWYGFRTLPPSGEVHLLVPHGMRCRSNGFAVVKRAVTLDTAARHSSLYQVAAPARAVIDACRELRELRTVRAVMAEAVQRFRVPPQALDREVRRAARSRTAIVRKVLTEIAEGARSAPEAQTRAVLEASPRLAGRLLWNPRLALEDGRFAAHTRRLPARIGSGDRSGFAGVPPEPGGLGAVPGTAQHPGAVRRAGPAFHAVVRGKSAGRGTPDRRGGGDAEGGDHGGCPRDIGRTHAALSAERWKRGGRRVAVKKVPFLYGKR